MGAKSSNAQNGCLIERFRFDFLQGTIESHKSKIDSKTTPYDF